MRKSESPAEQPRAAVRSEHAQAAPGGSVEHSNPCRDARKFVGRILGFL